MTIDRRYYVHTRAWPTLSMEAGLTEEILLEITSEDHAEAAPSGFKLERHYDIAWWLSMADDSWGWLTHPEMVGFFVALAGETSTDFSARHTARPLAEIEAFLQAHGFRDATGGDPR